MKKIFEKIVEGILACSGFVTSLTIVLIVVFLFSEALGLFSSKVIEEGYVLALNKENRVGELTPAQIKNVFDEELTNWNEVGGEDLPIRLFRLEDTHCIIRKSSWALPTKMQVPALPELVERTPGIIAFVPQQFIVRPDSVHLLKDNTISVKDVFAGANGFPRQHLLRSSAFCRSLRGRCGSVCLPSSLHCRLVCRWQSICRR